MQIVLIALLPLAILSLMALAYAYVTAREGYEDEAGFHVRRGAIPAFARKLSSAKRPRQAAAPDLRRAA